MAGPDIATLHAAPSTEPQPQFIGWDTHQSILDVHNLKLRLNKGGRGYRLQDDWNNPLIQVADKPPTQLLKKCLTWNGKKYFISDNPVTLPEARQLATQLKGRLLTISSLDEETMIFQEGRNRKLWMSGGEGGHRSQMA